MDEESIGGSIGLCRFFSGVVVFMEYRLDLGESVVSMEEEEEESSWNSLRFASLTEPRAGRISADSWTRSFDDDDDDDAAAAAAAAVVARVGEGQAIVAAASEGEYLCAGLGLVLPLDLLLGGGARRLPVW